MEQQSLLHGGTLKEHLTTYVNTRMRPGHLLNVLFTFSLRLVFMEKVEIALLFQKNPIMSLEVQSRCSFQPGSKA